jgi:hypothetical protein
MLTSLVTNAAAQDQSTIDAKRQPSPPGVSSLLLDENAYYSAAMIDLPVGADTQIRQIKRDVVIAVVGGGPLNLIFSKSPNAEQIATDEVRFLARDTDLRILNSSDKPSQALVIELKQHWDAEVRTCVEPMKCSRPVRMGPSEIGDTTSLFTNGFIPAYRHRLVVRGARTSRYYSTKGKDHLLLIPLTNLRANFDGTEENLKQGQAYTSDATEVEVNADLSAARWVVVRVETPE